MVTTSSSPRAQVAPSRLTGVVYFDLNQNGVFDGPDAGIATVRVILSGVDDLGGAVMLQTTTGADGSYAFEGLRPGTYSLREVQPRVFRDSRDNIGTLGGIARNDRFDGIQVGPGVSGDDYNFGEIPRPGCRLRGRAALLGNAVAGLRRGMRRNPARSVGDPPRMGSTPVRGEGPGGDGPFPHGPLIHRYVPTLGRSDRPRTPRVEALLSRKQIHGRGPRPPIRPCIDPAGSSLPCLDSSLEDHLDRSARHPTQR